MDAASSESVLSPLYIDLCQSVLICVARLTTGLFTHKQEGDASAAIRLQVFVAATNAFVTLCNNFSKFNLENNPSLAKQMLQIEQTMQDGLLLFTQQEKSSIHNDQQAQHVCQIALELYLAVHLHPAMTEYRHSSRHRSDLRITTFNQHLEFSDVIGKWLTHYSINTAKTTTTTTVGHTISHVKRCWEPSKRFAKCLLHCPVQILSIGIVQLQRMWNDLFESATIESTRFVPDNPLPLTPVLDEVLRPILNCISNVFRCTSPQLAHPQLFALIYRCTVSSYNLVQPILLQILNQMPLLWQTEFELLQPLLYAFILGVEVYKDNVLASQLLLNRYVTAGHSLIAFLANNPEHLGKEENATENLSAQHYQMTSLLCHLFNVSFSQLVSAHKSMILQSALKNLDAVDNTMPQLLFNLFQAAPATSNEIVLLTTLSTLLRLLQCNLEYTREFAHIYSTNHRYSLISLLHTACCVCHESIKSNCIDQLLKMILICGACTNYNAFNFTQRYFENITSVLEQLVPSGSTLCIDGNCYIQMVQFLLCIVIKTIGKVDGTMILSLTGAQKRHFALWLDSIDRHYALWSDRSEITNQMLAITVQLCKHRETIKISTNLTASLFVSGSKNSPTKSIQSHFVYRLLCCTSGCTSLNGGIRNSCAANNSGAAASLDLGLLTQTVFQLYTHMRNKEEFDSLNVLFTMFCHLNASKLERINPDEQQMLQQLKTNFSPLSSSTSSTVLPAIVLASFVPGTYTSPPSGNSTEQTQYFTASNSVTTIAQLQQPSIL